MTPEQKAEGGENAALRASKRQFKKDNASLVAQNLELRAEIQASCEENDLLKGTVGRFREETRRLREALRNHLADPLIDDWTREHLLGCLKAQGLASPAPEREA